MSDDRMESLETMGCLALQRGAYWRIAMIENGQRGYSISYSQDEAKARSEWARLSALAPCKECGEKPFGHWAKSCQEEMDSRGLCFHCNHWTNILAKKSENTAIVEGHIYTIDPETEAQKAARCNWPTENGRLLDRYRHVLGHGGAEFEILFNDGRRVTTTSLWAGGPIPQRFRGRLPDNATFEARERSCAYVGLGSASV